MHLPDSDAVAKLRLTMNNEIAESMQRVGRRSGRNRLKQPTTASPLYTDVQDQSKDRPTADL